MFAADYRTAVAATTGTASVPYVADNFNDNAGGDTAFAGNDGMVNWGGAWTEIGEAGGAGNGDVTVEDSDRGRLRIRDDNNGASRGVDLSSLVGATYITLAVEYRISTGSPFEAGDFIDIDINPGTGWVNLGSINGDGVGSSTYTRLTFDIRNYATSSTQIRLVTRNGLSDNDQIYFRYIDIQYPDSTQNYCYLVADGHNDSGNDLLTLVTKAGTEAAIGSTLGTSYAESIAFQPGTTTLYATNQTGSTGVFGTVDLLSGVFSQISPGGGIGTGSGSLGNITFNDVDSLSFDPFTGELFAVLRREGTPNPPDVLFQIDLASGTYVADALGSGVDYVVIPDDGNTQWQDIDDIAVSPYDGRIFGVANASGSNDELVTIDKQTGALSLVGVIGVDDVEALAFDVEGNLFGTTGTGGGGTANSLYDISVANGAASNARALREGTDYESADCLTWGTNDIAGTVYEDADYDQTLDAGESRTAGVTVYLYRDVNGDGQVDASDVLLAGTDTDGNGEYAFGFPQGAAALGDFAIAIDTGDLPSGHQLTTDNVEVAQFATVGNSDTGNDFGHMTPTAQGTVHGHLYLDQNGDGTQDPGEPDLAGVDVVVTDANDGTHVVTTDANGDWAVLVPPGLTTADVDETDPDYPTGSTQTEGTDPTTVTAVVGNSVDGGSDGYYLPTISIGDRVWLDLNSDGVQDVAEPGLENVVVELDDGVCTAGVDCVTQTTDSGGNYLFTDLAAGTYMVVVRAASLPGGVTQTADPDTSFDNQHTLTGTAPNAYLDVDFGYQGTGSISDVVWHDIDGDSTQGAVEGGIEGVTVWVDLNDDGVQDADEPSAVTAVDGAYYIGGLPVGNYIVRTSGGPISGSTPTYDLDGVGTANFAAVTLTAGQNRTDVDFAYQFSVLSISKVSSVEGEVIPGETIQYTISVRNNTGAIQTGIAITDPLPDGTVYVADSTSVTGYTGGAAETVRDEFGTQAWDNNDGSANWAGAWVEIDPYGATGPDDGAIAIRGERLNLWWAWVDAERIERTVNLSAATSATLTYDWETDGLTDLMAVGVRVSTDGSNWTTLAEYGGTQSGSASVSLDSYLSANTIIRFEGLYEDWGAGQDAYFDNVQVSYSQQSGPATSSGGSPSDLVVASDGYTLQPDQSMMVTLEVAVDDPVALASIDNTASVTSDQQATPQYASTSDPVDNGPTAVAFTGLAARSSWRPSLVGGSVLMLVPLALGRRRRQKELRS